MAFSIYNKQNASQIEDFQIRGLVHNGLLCEMQKDAVYDGL